MKTKIITLLLMSFTYFSFSQSGDVECLVSYENNNAIDNSNYSGSIDPAVLASYEPVVYNIYFWIINNGDGSNDRIVTEDDALRNVASLNILYNKFNVFFKYNGYDDTSYNSTQHYSGSSVGAIKSFANSNGYVKENSFNVYIAYSFGSGAGQAFFNSTTTAVNSLHFTRSATNESDLITTLHEIAHNFYIKHTWSSGEHVTRDPNDTENFNALTAGDLVLDTAATKGFRASGCSPASDPACFPYITENCEYDDENSDELDNSNPQVPYAGTISPEDIANIMSDGIRSCKNSPFQLTVGQGIRIRETIVTDPNGVFTDAETTIASLFEPYSGEYYNTGPFNPLVHTPLFQPGFNYRFVECNGDYPQPSDYLDLNFWYNLESLIAGFAEDEQNYNDISHPNHSAIYISEIAQSATDANNLDHPRKCYNNWNRKPSGGSITKFNDGILNTNVTINPQDSTAINNPSLIQNLDNGLYKIEKVYTDGAVQETVIIKGNN